MPGSAYLQVVFTERLDSLSASGVRVSPYVWEYLPHRWPSPLQILIDFVITVAMCFGEGLKGTSKNSMAHGVRHSTLQTRPLRRFAVLYLHYPGTDMKSSANTL